MHPDLEKLILLQTHDLEVRRLHNELAALPKHIASLEAKLKAAEAHRASILDKLAKEEALRRRQESDISDHKSKIARIRKQMDLATTTAQITAFEHELTFAQGEISKLEDTELESLERTETLESEKPQAEAALLDARTTLDRERTSAMATAEADQQAVATVQAAAAALRPQVSESILYLYDRISKAKSTALAEVINQKCLACQMLLRPQKWNDLRDRSNNETIMTCDTCGRMLYYNPANDAPQRKPAVGESIAASIVRSSI